MLRVLPFLRGYTQSLVQSLVSLEAMFILKVGPPLLNIPRSTHGVEWLGITPPLCGALRSAAREACHGAE